MKFAIDIMNGDKSPKSTINAVLKYLKKNPKNNFFYLVGKKEVFMNFKNSFQSIPKNNFEFVYAEEDILDSDSPSRLYKRKPNSSLIKSIELLRDKKVDATISAGSTGALLASSLIMLGKIKNIKRPALAAFIPTDKGGFVLCDVGANSENKPEHLLQFSLMAKAYIQYLENIQNPKIALLNIGKEQNKGNSLSIETFKLLQQYSDNFIGNLESRYILDNQADIIICDGFTGNIVLKMIEGTISKMITWINSSINNHSISKMAKPLLYPVFNDIKKTFDYEEHGGVPLLGVNGIVIKCHGSSNSKAIYNGILNAEKCIRNDFILKIEESLNKIENE